MIRKRVAYIVVNERRLFLSAIIFERVFPLSLFDGWNLCDFFGESCTIRIGWMLTLISNKRLDTIFKKIITNGLGEIILTLRLPIPSIIKYPSVFIFSKRITSIIKGRISDDSRYICFRISIQDGVTCLLGSRNDICATCCFND